MWSAFYTEKMWDSGSESKAKAVPYATAWGLALFGQAQMLKLDLNTQNVSCFLYQCHL